MEEARWITENGRYYIKLGKRDYSLITKEVVDKFIKDLMHGTVGD